MTDTSTGRDDPERSERDATSIRRYHGMSAADPAPADSSPEGVRFHGAFDGTFDGEEMRGIDGYGARVAEMHESFPDSAWTSTGS